MRIIHNERHIKIRRSIGMYLPIAAAVIMLVMWLLSMVRPEWFMVVLWSLPLVVLLFVVGGFFSNRYAGSLAHHDALARVLKGLDDQYVLLEYLLPASHVLLEPGGCSVFVVKTQGGQVAYQEDGRWRHWQRWKFFRQFAGQDAVGAPSFEAKRQVDKLERWLAARMLDVEVPVRAAIVFANPNVQVDAAASPVPAFYGKKVKAWLRGPGKLKPLPSAVYRQLAETLGAAKPQQEED